MLFKSAKTLLGCRFLFVVFIPNTVDLVMIRKVKELILLVSSTKQFSHLILKSINYSETINCFFICCLNYSIAQFYKTFLLVAITYL